MRLCDAFDEFTQNTITIRNYLCATIILTTIHSFYECLIYKRRKGFCACLVFGVCFVHKMIILFAILKLVVKENWEQMILSNFDVRSFVELFETFIKIHNEQVICG